MSKKCIRCLGNGEFLGSGMLIVPCNLCNEENAIERTSTVNNLLDKIDKRSKHYKDAIKDIMDVNSGLSRKEAEEMFDNIYYKDKK